MGDNQSTQRKLVQTEVENTVQYNLNTDTLVGFQSRTPILHRPAQIRIYFYANASNIYL